MSQYGEERFNEHLRKFHSMPITPIKAKEPDTIWNTITNIKPNDVMNVSAVFLSIAVVTVFVFKYLKPNKNNFQAKERSFSMFQSSDRNRKMLATYFLLLFFMLIVVPWKATDPKYKDRQASLGYHFIWNPPQNYHQKYYWSKGSSLDVRMLIMQIAATTVLFGFIFVVSKSEKKDIPRQQKEMNRRHDFDGTD